MEFFNSFLPTIQHFGMFGYWIVLLISLAEVLPFIGLFIPSATVVGLFGFLSAQGYFDIVDLIWFSAIGAVLGDGISYYLGTKGTKFFRQENKIFKLSHLEKGERFFRKHGSKSIFLSRFISPVRPMIPFIAGLSRMNKKVFMFWNIVSGVLWAASFLLLGYFFGGALNTIAVWSNRIGIFILGTIILLIVIRIFVKYAPQLFAFLKSIFLSIKTAIADNQDIKNFIANHPIFFRFIGRRLNKDRFFGLPFTLFGIVFLYVLFLFFGIIQDIIASDLVVSADMRVANLLFVFRNAELVRVFTWITLLAKWQVIMSSAAILSVIFWLWKKKIYLLPLWITITGSEIFNYLGKLAFHRSRPDVALYIEDTFSFPSGHSTIAVAFYGFLVYMLFRQIKKWKYKINTLFFGIVLIFAVGLSRLYLGVHFLSDVWSGYLLGTLWLVIGITISEWLLYRTPLLPSATIPKMKITVAVLILAEFVFYVNFAFNYNPPVARQKTPSVSVIADPLDMFQNKQISRFTETLIGDWQEPLNFIVIAKNDKSFADIMQKAGWYLADPATFVSVAKLAKSAILKENYPTAPMTPSFWNAKTHDFGFEKPTETKRTRERHHARFWRTQFKTQDGNHIYVGMTKKDIDIEWLIIHNITLNIDMERDLLFFDLENTGFVLNFIKEKFVDPMIGMNFSGDQFFTDGKAYVIILK